MKIRIFLLVLSTIFYTESFCQSDYTVIGKEICKELQLIDKEQNKIDLQQVLTSRTNKVYSKNPEIIENLRTEISKRMLNSSDNEIALAIGKDISVYLMETCDIFVKISHKIAQVDNVPDKKCLQLIGNDICGLIMNSKKKSLNELDKVVNDNLFSFILKYEKQVNIDYKGGIENSAFSNDLNAYMMNTCEIYFKISLILYGQ